MARIRGPFCFGRQTGIVHQRIGRKARRFCNAGRSLDDEMEFLPRTPTDAVAGASPEVVGHGAALECRAGNLSRADIDGGAGRLRIPANDPVADGVESQTWYCAILSPSASVTENRLNAATLWLAVAWKSDAATMGALSTGAVT